MPRSSVLRRPWLWALLGVLLFVRSAVAAQISDERLTERIAEAVREYVHFGIFDDVTILVENRSVTLGGRVTMPYKKSDIVERVKKIDGIRDLTVTLEVLPVSQSDSELRDRLARAIYGHPSFRHYASMVNPPIHIVVERGRVVLTGAVASDVEKALAYSLAAQIPGAFSVLNALRVER